VIEAQPGRVTYPNADSDVRPTYPIYSGLSRAAGTDWYGPNVGRESDRWLVAPPPRRISLASPLYGPRSSLPFTWAHIGRHVWILDAAHKSVRVGHASEDVGPPPMALDTFTRFYLARSLGAVLNLVKSNAAQCRTGRYLGRSMIAGRPAWVIAVSRQSCYVQFPPGPIDGGRFVVWIDTQTSFVLRWDQYDYGDRHQLLSRTYVTSVRYNVPLSPSLFRLTVPPGYQRCRIIDAATTRCSPPTSHR
jgi:hypothetical protein